jgi:uncharacterized protein YeaO (DUF488 family)
MTAPAQVRLRRVYEAPDPSDGQRVLVDRLWPRGLAKNKAAVDEWLKTVAPSDELRRWYGHEQELRGPEQSGALDHLRQLASHGTVTLLTATRDIEHSQAAVLAELLRGADEQ